MSVLNVTQITNYVALSIGRLRSQLTETSTHPVVQAFLTALANRVQEIENAFWQIYTLRFLSVATGAQLDGWGSILSIPRNGLSDTDYRTLLYFWVGVYNSFGTPAEMISVFKFCTDATKIQYTERYPAGFAMTALNVYPNVFPIVDIQGVANIINFIKPAGVAVISLVITDVNPFGFFGDPGAEGFGAVYANGTNCEIGGDFAGAIE